MRSVKVSKQTKCFHISVWNFKCFTVSLGKKTQKTTISKQDFYCRKIKFFPSKKNVSVALKFTLTTRYIFMLFCCLTLQKKQTTDSITKRLHVTTARPIEGFLDRYLCFNKLIYQPISFSVRHTKHKITSITVGRCSYLWDLTTIIWPCSYCCSSSWVTASAWFIWLVSV